jgi:tetratricopeptide (TPR) repeat protein
MGNFDAGEALVSEAMHMSEAIGSVWGQSYSRWVMGELLAERGKIGQAMRLLDEAVRLGEQAGFVFAQISTRAQLGLLYAELGAFEQGAALAEDSIRIAQALQPSLVSIGHTALAQCYMQQGRLSEAAASLAVARKTAAVYDLSLMVYALAQIELDLKHSDFARAAQSAAETLRVFREYGMFMHVPNALFFAGLAAQGMNDWENAAAHMREAVERARALGAHRLLWRILSALAVCEEKLGHIDVARDVRAQADGEIVLIADSLDSATLRASFLKRAAL